MGVCSSIAAYKAAYLARLLSEHYAVHTILTRNAQQFIGKATFAGITHHKVWDDMWDETAPKHMAHIELTRTAKALLVAPCSAHMMAKICHGMADDLLSTAILARSQYCPVFLAPAMNVEMWQNSSTQRNVAQLLADGVHILGPDVGQQACGEYGFGRMLEPDAIAQAVYFHLHHKPLLGKKVLITAGPTQEWLDNVRYLSNASSGLMGFALAKQAAYLGAQVVLVSGPVHQITPWGVQRVDVVSAQEMLNAVKNHLSGCDIFIGNAAVADWQVRTHADASHKLPKEQLPQALIWQLNPDILAYVASQNPKPYCVGFAAQSHDILAYARAKQIKKNVQMMIANHTQYMYQDNNAVSILTGTDAPIEDVAAMPKKDLAVHIWQRIMANL